MENSATGGSVLRTRLLGGILALALIIGVSVVWAVTTTTKAEAQARPNQPPGLMYGLLNSDRLIEFTKNDPSNIRAVRNITGIEAGETLVGIDFRPANARMYGVTINAAGEGAVYLIAPARGNAVKVADLVEADSGGSIISPETPAILEGGNFGVDFNPVPDRLRVVSDTGQNLRINVDNGATITDGDLEYNLGLMSTPPDPDPNAGTPPQVSGAAYTNNFDGATSTTLYDIDSNLNILAIQAPPNDGTLNTVGSLGNNIGPMIGFDFRRGFGAVAAVRTQGGAAPSNLVQINLQTGNATNLGRIGGAVKAIAIPGPFEGPPSG